MIGVTQERLKLRRGRFRTGQFEFDIDDRLHMQKEITGVLDAPFGVRDLEFSGSLPVVAHEFGVNVSDEFVVGAVKRDDAFQFKVGGRGKGNLAVDLLGPEGGFGELPGFKDFLVQALVPRTVAGFAADGVYDDRAAGFAGLRIELQRAAFQGERAVHHMHRAVHVEVNFGLRRIEGQRDFMRCRRRGLQARRRGRGGKQHREAEDDWR